MKVKLLFIALKIPGVIGNVNYVDLKNHCLVFFFIFYFLFYLIEVAQGLGSVYI